MLKIRFMWKIIIITKCRRQTEIVTQLNVMKRKFQNVIELRGYQIIFFPSSKTLSSLHTVIPRKFIKT